MIEGEHSLSFNLELERIQSIPLVFIFGPHGDHARELGGLNLFKDAVMNPLKEQPAGEILIPYEFTNHSIEERDHLLELIQSGILPSQAITTVYDAYARKRLSNENYERAKSAGFNNWFSRSYKEILDEAFTRFPGRIELMPEWAPDEEINHEGFSQGTQQTRDFIETYRAGEIPLAFQKFKDMSIYLGANARRREKRIISDIKDKLSSEPAIIGVTGYFGRGHTGIALELKKQGFATSSTIADMEPHTGRVPLDRVPRSIRFLSEDKEFSEKDWEKIFEKVTGTQIKHF